MLINYLMLNRSIARLPVSGSQFRHFLTQNVPVSPRRLKPTSMQLRKLTTLVNNSAIRAQQKLMLLHTKRHGQSQKWWMMFRFRNCSNITGKKPGDAEIPKVKMNKRDVSRLLKLVASEKLVLTAGVVCLIISSAISMYVPAALGKILDIIFKSIDSKEHALKRLKNFCLILCGVFVLGGAANYARILLFNSASLRIVRDLRLKLYSTMLNQEAAWFDTKGTGELLNRLVNDTYIVGNSLSQNLSDGLRSTVMVVAGTGMMIYTSPELALVGTCVVPCIAGVAIIFGRYMRQITKALLDKFAEISKSLEERLGNVRTVKIFGKEDAESKHYAHLYEDAMQLGYREVKARSIFFGSTGLLGNVVIVSVLYYGGTLVAHGTLSLGELTSFILYATYTAMSINGISNFYTELNKGIGAGQRIWEIFERKPQIPYNEGFFPTSPPIGQVVFDNICFAFPSRPNSVILNNFNLTFMPGETTAIVGRSGSGKTTIAMLLLRLYDPTSGRILLDGIDLHEISPKWLRRNIGAVSQEPILFSGSIRDNIMYGAHSSENVHESIFMDAVRQAYVDEFSSRLPQGLNTVVGQRGVMLSGGQKQRVAIARALIRNPSILILDEATSSLDALSEELVQNALEQLSKGRTVITIAHRLSTIRNADKIAVLDNGFIKEQGSYFDLLQRDAGIFKDLVAKQTFASTN